MQAPSRYPTRSSRDLVTVLLDNNCSEHCRVVKHSQMVLCAKRSQLAFKTLPGLSLTSQDFPSVIWTFPESAVLSPQPSALSSKSCRSKYKMKETLAGANARPPPDTTGLSLRHLDFPRVSGSFTTVSTSCSGSQVHWLQPVKLYLIPASA